MCCTSHIKLKSMCHITLTAPGHFMTQHALLSNQRMLGSEWDGKGPGLIRGLYVRCTVIHWYCCSSQDLHVVTAIWQQQPWAGNNYSFFRQFNSPWSLSVCVCVHDDVPRCVSSIEMKTIKKRKNNLESTAIMSPWLIQGRFLWSCLFLYFEFKDKKDCYASHQL